MTPLHIPVAVPIVVTLALAILAAVTSRNERPPVPMIACSIAAGIALAAWIAWSWL